MRRPGPDPEGRYLVGETDDPMMRNHWHMARESIIRDYAKTNQTHIGAYRDQTIADLGEYVDYRDPMSPPYYGLRILGRLITPIDEIHVLVVCDEIKQLVDRMVAVGLLPRAHKRPLSVRYWLDKAPSREPRVGIFWLLFARLPREELNKLLGWSCFMQDGDLFPEWPIDAAPNMTTEKLKERVKVCVL